MTPADERERIRRVVLVVLVSAITALFLWMIREFLMALLLAAIVAGILQPAYRRVLARLGGRRSLAAGVVVGLLTLLGIAPLAGLAVLAGVQAAALVKAADPVIRASLAGGSLVHRLVEHFPRLSMLEKYEAPITEKLGELGASVGKVIVGVFTAAAGETLSFLLIAFVLLYAIFYFLVGGREVLRTLLYYSPLPSADEDRLVGRFLSVTRATLKGTLVVGLVQGTLGGLGLWAADIGGAVFWGVVMTILSVIPSLGVAIVWVPAVVYLYATGHTVAATLLLAWCTLVVSTVRQRPPPGARRQGHRDARPSDLAFDDGGYRAFRDHGIRHRSIDCGHVRDGVGDLR